VTEARQDDAPDARDDAVHADGYSVFDALRSLCAVGLALGGFTAAGALALCVYTRLYPELDAIQRPLGLILRVGLFGLVTAFSAWGLWRLREKTPGLPPVFHPQPITHRAKLALAALCCLGLTLLGYNLPNYPWAAPDEVHHLNVARNLALHGSYASGHPEMGLNYFDSFDSVGPTVIGPVALAFNVLGVSLEGARAVMVAYFLLLAGTTFFVARLFFGTWPGVAATALLLGTFSSIYLGRTLYGEVPAYAWLLLGLLAWQRALGQPGASAWGVLAGTLIAFAVLTKTIIILVAFSAAAAWAYDRTTFRDIRGAHVALPLLGGALVFGAWGLVQYVHGPEGATDTGGVLDIYQHYLLFGVGGMPFAVTNSVFLNPVAHAVWLLVAIASAPLAFRVRYRPAAVVLYLYALFLLYWWFFFTPGQLHRYLWNAYAILAIFAAPWLVQFVRLAVDPTKGRRTRALCLAAALLLLGPGVRWVAMQGVEVATRDEMAADRALATAIDGLPPEYRLATTSGRIPGLLNFFSDRAVAGGESVPGLLAEFDVVVVPDSPELRKFLPPDTHLKPAGHFVLLSTAKPLE